MMTNCPCAFFQRLLVLVPIAFLFVAGCGGGQDEDDLTWDGGTDAAVFDVVEDGGADAVRDVRPDGDGDTIQGDATNGDAAGDSREDASETDAVKDVAEDVPELDYGFVPIPAVATCTATVDPCDTDAAAPAIWASYRKDYWLPQEQYDEKTTPQLDGGRFHIAAISAVTGNVTGVYINDSEVSTLLVEPFMEWYHVWPEQVVAGQPVWFAFHSRNPVWDSAIEGDIRIETDAGVAVEGKFPVAVNKVPAGAVSLATGGDALWLHLKNDDTVAHQATRVILNGQILFDGEAPSAGPLCLPYDTLQPGQTAMWSLPLCGSAVIGTPYTVVVEFAGAPPSVSVGRILRPFFPIEVWPSSKDCALPGHENGFWGDLDEIGVDTVYYYWNGFDRCGFDRDTMLGQTLPEEGDAYVLLGDDFPFDDPPEDPIPVRDNVLGFLTGDESDWSIYNDETGFPNAANKARKTRAIWRLYPDLLTYNGAMTNKHVGVFAGMADIQGIDFYNAACAPHITEFGVHPPLRGPYDYLRNARNNHMPWLTWFYSQGTGSWDGHAAPHEIAIQAISVMAAGAKGLMWFMATQEGRDNLPDTWQAMSDANHIFKGMREYLRQGDITGAAQSDPDTIVDMIRADGVLVVPVITAKAEVEMTDENCAFWSLGLLEEEPHWILAERATDVTITVPDDFAVNDLFEVVAPSPENQSGISEITTPILVQGRQITLVDVPLSNTEPTHVYVFATDSATRQAITDAMAE